MDRNTFTLSRRRDARRQRCVAVSVAACVVCSAALAQKANVSLAIEPGDNNASKVSEIVKMSDAPKQLKRSLLRESLQSQTAAQTPKPTAVAHHLSPDQRARLREELRQQHRAAQLERTPESKTACPNECQEKP